MFKHATTLIVMVAVTATLCAQVRTLAQAETPKSKVLAMLQGTWVFTSQDGQDLSGGPQITVTVVDNTYTQMVNGQLAERGTFKIDETKKPMTVDLSVSEGEDAGKTQLGIFEITDTTMKAKLTQPGGTMRPTDFAVADGYSVITATKRAK